MNLQYDCPDGWSVNTIGNSDDYYCCWGAGHINGDDGYCCTNKYSKGSSGSGGGEIASDDEIRSDCFPFCDRKRQNDDLCGEKIPFSASDYSERVSAASKSAMSETATDSPATNTAESTSSDESASSTGNDGPSETGGSNDASDAGDSDSAEETNSDNAGPIPTGDAMAKIGGAMAAAALFAL